MPTGLSQPSRTYAGIVESLRELYLSDARPWLLGFSGGKDSTLLASLVFDAVLPVPAEARQNEIAVVGNDTRSRAAYLALEGSLRSSTQRFTVHRVPHALCRPRWTTSRERAESASR